MFKAIIEKFKNNSNERKIFQTWQDNIIYINSLSKNKVIVTQIFYENSFFLLIYLSNKIFFLHKEPNKPFESIYGEAHENIVKNTKIWECIKYSKISGNVLETSSMMLYIADVLQNNKEKLNISYCEEKDMWFDICDFIKEIDTTGINIPKYKKGENLWVD